MNGSEDHSIKVNIFDITNILIKKLNLIIISTIILTAISFFYVRTIATLYTEKFFLIPATFLESYDYANFNKFAFKVGLSEINSEKLFNQGYELLAYKQEIKNQIMLNDKINSTDFLNKTEYEKEIIKFAKDRFKVGIDEFNEVFIEINGDINEREYLTKILFNAWDNIENRVKNHNIERINNFLINYEKEQQYEISDINNQILRLKEKEYKNLTTEIKKIENAIIQKKDSTYRKYTIDRNYLNEQIKIAKILEIKEPKLAYLNEDKSTVKINLTSIQDPYFLRGYKLLEKELEILEKKLSNYDSIISVDMINLDDFHDELEFYRKNINDPNFKSEELISLEDKIKKITDNQAIDRFNNEYLKTSFFSVEKKFSIGKISDKSVFLKLDYKKRIVLITLILSFFFSMISILYIEYYFRYKNRDY